MKIELKVDPELCAQLKDPSGGITHLESLLSFSEAVKLKIGNANVRPPEQKKKPFRAMLETVEFSPQTFHLKNRGITYICSDIKYDEKNGNVTVTIPSKEDDNERFGIADGGHTFEVVHQTIRDERDKRFEAMTRWVMPHVRVHFLATTNHEDIEPIVEALNTSLQVQQYTLDEYQNKFEALKVALERNGFDPGLVAWRENEDKEWHVIEIIQRLACFLKDRWVGEQPISMYKSKGKALKLFTNEDTRDEFRQLFPVIKEIITLPEYIQHELSKGGIVNARSLGKLKCVKVLKRTDERPGTDYTTDHKIDLAALLPMASGFRELLVKQGSDFAWKVPLKEVFDQAIPDLYNLLTDRVALVNQSNQLASDISFWAGCANIILRKRNEIFEEPGGYRKTIVRKKAVAKDEEEEVAV